MSPNIARGTRDAAGKWHAEDPAEYPPMDVHGTLPWSVLRQDSAPWQARKKHWLALGVHADAPRAHAPAMINTGRHGKVSGGLSRFDPHLAELLYAWYCPPTGAVLDPFAGGPCRGLVAGHLGRPYEGYDLMQDQVDANYRLRDEWEQQHLLGMFDGARRPSPVWHCADALETLTRRGADAPVDYVLTCPPFHNRERYSNDPRDLSAMPWREFAEVYTEIIRQAVRLLRTDRFATFVVSDVRDSKGHLRGLPALTTEAFRAAGAHLVNEQILIEPGGLRAKTMRIPWQQCRTATRTHQLVLTYVKGDRRTAAAAVKGDPPC